MKLKKLISKSPNIIVKNFKDIEISGVCTDSRKVYPKNIFFALKGSEHDGSEYIYEAVSNGAVAIVTDLYDPFLKSIVQIITKSPHDVFVEFVEAFYQSPSSKLSLVGLTGTNGKTTTSFLLKHIIEKANKKSGLIGTCEYHIGSNIYPAPFTTPPLDFTAKFIKEMVDCGTDVAIMETSSHGLYQRRCDTLNFDVAIYTNLTEEHLDYHKSMQSYADAKRILFALLEKSTKQNKIAILNSDCRWHKHMIDGYNANHLTYGVENNADVMASDINLLSDGSEFIVRYKEYSQKFNTKLVGRFNVYNILAAICYGLYLGITLDRLALFISDFTGVKGRMEKINAPFGQVFVDFAHTPNALENCLKTLSELKKSRIITVFGCGGNRDTEKRPKMAEIAEKYSDLTIVTSDNPRREDPQKIVSEIIAGFKLRSSYDVILDRMQAINNAIEVAKDGDIVLIAGKGHETKQIFAHRTIDFDDVKVVQKIISVCV